MSRSTKNIQRIPYIIVFWEGESEEEYMKFMRAHFHKYANITVHNKKGVWIPAKKAFKKAGTYFNDKKEVDEIWLVFDTEIDLRNKWDEYSKIVASLRRLNPYINVRLLMTKGCIEYYFLLHYKKCAPQIQIKADKTSVENELKRDYCPGYKKGDPISIKKIAPEYKTAIKNGKWSIARLEEELGRNLTEKDMFTTDLTFSNAYEGIEYLDDLKNNKLSGS